ncbi:MAG: DUF6492 family protein, partial [Candidatus Berkelbacteria bacterium]|nr:DUF6492 family protein [Candidatus Berkelbacteria bacterium]
MIQKLKSFFGHPIVKYYSVHPIILLQNRLLIFSLWSKKFFGRDLNFKKNIRSTVPIDIVIVAIDKDFDVLTHVIDSARKNIFHPIGDIIIISPKSKLIQGLCKKKKCVFIDETTVLPIGKKDIGYIIDGKDRSGWIFQQLLKWSGDKYAKNDFFLIADADTVFCRPQVFVYEGRILMPACSQLGHIPYYQAYEKLTGEKVPAVVNFTSHHSLFDKNKLAELKTKIEKHCKTNWYNAIISTKEINPTEGSCVSDYETYGQFVFSRYYDECRLEHWFNLSLNRNNLKRLSKLMK